MQINIESESEEQVFLPKINTPLELKINKIIIYQSDLKPNGPIYTPLWTGNLNN